MSRLVVQRATQLARRGGFKVLVALGAPLPTQLARGLAHASKSRPSGGNNPFAPRNSITQQTGRARECARNSSSGGGGGSGSGGMGGGGGGGGGEQSPRGLSGLWAAYLSLLDRQPVLTKAVTASLLNAVGDIVSQRFVEENNTFDWKRTAIFTFLGLVLVGPALHFWYGTLARLVPQAGTQGAFLRLAGDQLGFAPPFIAVFFSSLFVLEGRSDEISAKLKQDWKGAVLANWKLWIPFQFINFRFVPQQLQVLAANVVAVGWNTYLSWASHKQVAT